MGGSGDRSVTIGPRHPITDDLIIGSSAVTTGGAIPPDDHRCHCWRTTEGSPTTEENKMKRVYQMPTDGCGCCGKYAELSQGEKRKRLRWSGNEWLCADCQKEQVQQEN